MDSVKSDEARKPAEQDCSPDGVFPAPYYLLGSIPALLNLLFVESHPWVPVFFIFGFIPLLEFLVGPRRHNAIPAEKRRRRRRSLNEVPLFRIVLLMHAALSLASLMRTILYIHGKPSSLTVLRVFSTIPVVINSLVAGHEACQYVCHSNTGFNCCRANLNDHIVSSVLMRRWTDSWAPY